MKEFFANMETIQQMYWYIAIGVSVIFIIQTIMTFAGADSDTGGDADFDGNLDGGDAPFQLFSLRNLINFLLGFGWTGASLYNAFDSKVVVGILATIVGLVFVGIFFLVFRALMRLAEDNSFKIEETIGKTGDVYTRILGEGKGKGKIFISVRGTTHELNAMTHGKENIEVGTIVKVTAVDNGILTVIPA